ncbi:MAG: hypothetical protein M1813_004609, partial [Trichoglossum hirsutum]
KLTGLLTERQITAEVLDSKLRITSGSSKDAAAVRATLATGPRGVVDLVVSGLGGKPQFLPNPLQPRLDDPTVCGGSMAVLLAELGTLPSPAPAVVVVSTTGLPSAPVRDVPLLLLPLYRLLLHNPHVDKQAMEDLLFPTETPAPNHPVAIVVRASLLTDGPRKGDEAVRASGDDQNPAVGYTISREDVGAWIFGHVVENKNRAQEWGGKRVTITY